MRQGHDDKSRVARENTFNGFEDVLDKDFKPAWPWLTGDLQTIRNQLLYGGFKVALPSLDETGLLLSWPDGDQSPCLLTEAGRKEAPLVVLIHGLTGCTGSYYMIRSAAALSGRGFPTLRINLRAAGPAARYCQDCYHAGKSEDLQALLEDLAVQRPDFLANGFFLMGFSLGGAMMLRFLARESFASQVRGAIAVSAPLNLFETSQRFRAPRNRLYHHWLLSRMKADTAGLRLSPREKDGIQSAKSVFEFDDRFIAPRFGFSSAEDYYTRMSAEQALNALQTPTLLIHALDDPWIPAEMYLRLLKPSTDSRSKEFGESPYTKLVLPSGGGHVGFHGRGMGAQTGMSYHDQLACDFFEKVSEN